MLQELMWYFSIKHQYELQKRQGAAGFFALLATIFIIWQWDNIFYPILNAIGLVSLAEASGLIDHGGIMSGMQTFTNIFLFFLFISLCIGILSAIPMAILLLAISTTKPVNNIFTTVLGLCLFPFLLMVFVFNWLGEKLGFFKPANNIQTYVRNNPELSTGLNLSLNSLSMIPKKDYLTIYAQQQTQVKNIATTITEYSLEQATSYLNQFVKDISDTRFLVGYKEKYDSWFLLFPSPIPVHASKTLLHVAKHEVGSIDDPIGFKAMTMAYRSQSNDTLSINMNFYVPAEYCEIYFDPDKQSMRFTQKHNSATIVNLAELDHIFHMESALNSGLVQNSFGKNALLKDLMEDAIGLALYLPLMDFENEILRFKNKVPGSYYRALKDVHGTYGYNGNYKKYAVNIAKFMAQNTHYTEAQPVLDKLVENQFSKELAALLAK